ncbi:hypothetical protein NQ317_005304 [Molorchus minor]|uniref:Transcription factor TFIIIC triple barrel domain-containing protein n=1 Tax=Molorchus minor TaxID=1323400 RepID=A0ABQ9IYF3_9CUCU|nr:hypothetical protein NQ317_005304 [Molorchus minor]
MEENNPNCSTASGEKYAFLDFNGTLSSDVFDKEFYFRIANLHKNNPLVQVNDNVFKGVYDYSVGTNLFFEEIEGDLPPPNAFEKQGPIYLRHILSEMKVINLKAVKIPQQRAVVSKEDTKFDLNLDWDYNELLEKLENGSLHIGDIVKTGSGTTVDMVEEDDQVIDSEVISSQMETYTNPPSPVEQEENVLENIVPVKMLELEYEKLSALARRPVKRAASPELVEKCDTQYEEAYEYHNIERQILQPSDAFRIEKVTEINESILNDCVDIDRCVLYGIIPPSTLFPRILSKKEKEKLLTLENFENLSLAARYFVLQNHVQDLENYVKTAPKDLLTEQDEFHRTPLQTLEIYKKLSHAVLNRLQEIKYSLENETDKENCAESTSTAESSFCK